MIGAILEMPARPRISVSDDEPNLDQLLTAIASGDRQALKTLYDAIAPRLFAILVRMVRRREVAEDLLQDTFVTIWKKAHQFDSRRGNARAWLFSMTRRKAIDRLRVANRESLGLEGDVASLDSTAELWAPGLDSETQITLGRAIEALRPDVSRAMKLCYYHGLTHEELADELKVPLGTAKSWIKRGLAQMKLCMTPI
jgi:RNA polymerase sigma-70 factor (ECF subfamily)